MFGGQDIRSVGGKIGQAKRGEDGKGMRSVSIKRILAARDFKIISSLVADSIKIRVNPSKFRLKTTKCCSKPTKHPLCGRFMSRIIATASVF
jgi:hypothetical protein